MREIYEILCLREGWEKFEETICEIKKKVAKILDWSMVKFKRSLTDFSGKPKREFCEI